MSLLASTASPIPTDQATSTPLLESTEATVNFLARLTQLDFWLGVPLRILIILVLGLTIQMGLRLTIRKITDSIARGTRSRILGADAAGLPSTDLIGAQTQVLALRQAQRAKTVGSVLHSVASMVTWTVMIVMIIAEMGFNIAPVIASAGVVGVALSFGAQSLVKDFLSGIFIVAEDQLGIGDWVDLGEAQGRVEAVGLRTTQVRDQKGTLWHVRNGEILRVGNASQGPVTPDTAEAPSPLLESPEAKD